MVPDRGTPKVNVEVSEAVFDAHKAVTLYLRFGKLDLLTLLNTVRPQLVYPADLLHHPRGLH